MQPQAVCDILNRFLTLTNYMPANEAYDQVFGAGAYQKLMSEVYDELRARHG
jgi:hypothetical protein